MKLTKKLEAEVLKAYKAYWDAYLNGDMKSFASMLADNITVFGTAVSEVFKNKKETLRFYKATADQLVGKAQFRNRQIKVQAVDNNMLVNEQSDFHFLMDGKWTYYGPARVSAILTKTRSGWKLAHQHASFPDTRADEGEQFATEKIKAENQQLRDAVKRRTIQLEETNRELEIESALERVRAVAMGMKKPGDMLTVCNVISKQLEQLGIRNIRNVQTVIFNSSTTIYLDYEYYPLKDQNIITEVDYMLQPDVKAFAKKMMKAPDTFYTRSFKGAELTKWNRYQKKTKQVIDPRQHKATGLHFYFYSISVGALGISVFTPLSNDEIRMFKRFRNVFELAYKRFTDIQKAEAQAREARIEVAVERVRAKALAMHKSEEILGVVVAMQKELIGLNITNVTAATIYLKEDDGRIRTWDFTTFDESEPDFQLRLDFVFRLEETDPDLWIRRIWSSKEKYCIVEQDEEDFVRLVKFLRKNNERAADNVQRLIKKHKIKHSWHPTVRLAHGKMNVDFIEPPPAEMEFILPKMGAAFDLAYKRFLDLKNAEAQAREAQVEAALEKIRSRSLAMHHSKELKDVIATLFEKLDELNVLHGTVAIQLFDHASMNSFLWVGNAIQDPQMVNMPYDKKMMLENTYVKDGWEAMREGRDIINKEYSLKEKNKFFKYVFANNDMTQVPEGAREVLRKIRRHIVCLFTEKNSALFVDSFDGQFFSQENLAIIKRAARVFEQSYIRFLDLQKAEAQAREAQIEASLERVRAKTMGMHKSSDLLEVVKILGEQLELLGVEFDSVNFNTDYLEKDWNLWLYNSGVPMYPDKLHIPYLDHPCFNRPKEAYKEGTDFQSFVFTKEEKDSLFDHIYTNSIARNVPEERKKYTYAGAGLVWSMAFTKHTSVTVSNYRAEPFTEEENAIFRRFANVFEQSYTRFLDLQNAEAQAREAQIEAALERVRARTMGMHQSKELHDVIETVTNQLMAIGLKFDNSVFCTVNEDLSWEMWMSTPQQSYPSIIHIPYIDHRVFNNLREIKAKNTDFFTDVFDQKEARTFFKHFFENTIAKNAPEERKQYVLSRSGFARSLFFIKNIWFVISRYVPEPFSAEENAVLKRFAKVFEQSYTRFLDLQKAEAQAREAEIELALERVRARTMAMQKPAEFNEVIDVIGEQFLHLGFDIQWATFSAKGLDITGGLDIWIFAVIPGLFRSADRLFIPRAPHPIFAAYEQALKDYQTTAKDFFVMTFDKADKNSWLDHLHDTTTYKDLPPELLAIDYDKPGYTNSVVMLKDTWLSIGKHDSIPFNDEQNAILKRFSVAFGQAYTRFLDLQKAEEQARESQIQLALERVRARTMAMQRSEEFMETAVVLFDQLRKLGENIERTIIGLMNEEEGVVNVWATRPDGSQMDKMQKFPIDEPILMQKVYAAWRQQKKSIVIDLRGEELQSYFQFLKGRSSRLRRESFGERRVENFAFFSKGILGVINADPNTPADVELYERFAAVFEQTYTRFLDLQKAEAQAREAQIQLALERIRARTTAMHHSKELEEVITVVLEKLEELGVAMDYRGAIIVVCEPGYRVMTQWVISKFQPLATGIYTPYYDNPILADYWKAKESGAEFYEKSYSKKDKDLLFSYFFNNLGFQMPEESRELIFQIPYYSLAAAIEQNSSVVLASHIQEQLTPNEIDLLKRFAKVFEQTYTRFLDLQKAEAQAREAQVEVALERVRSKAMAMHKTEDLTSAVSLLFDELDKLEPGMLRCGIGILHREKRTADVWTTAKSETGTHIQTSGDEPMDIHPLLQGDFDAWLRQEEFSYTLEGKDLENYYQVLTETNFQLPESASFDTIKKDHKQYYYVTPFELGTLFAFRETEFTAEAKIVMKRFATVFSLTYKRFLDLQKAEEQAREAQIETALERIRSRTMGMQKSEELKEVIRVVYEQFVQLNIQVEHAGFIIDYKQRDDMHIWLADQHEVPFQVTIPYFDCAHWNSFIDAKLNGKDFFANKLGFEEKNRFYKALFDLIPVPDEAKEYYFNCPGLAISTVLLENVGLYIENFSGIPYADEENNILMRFGKVFQQTYTRFLDLQKAEAQAREAQIEAALERVRSRSMGMQKSDELAEVVAVLYKQFEALDFGLYQVLVSIYDKKNNVIEWWSRGFGDIELPQRNIIPIIDHPFCNDLLEKWENGVDYYPHLLEGEMKRSWDEYLFTSTDLKNFPQQIIDTMRGIDKVYVSDVFMKYGSLQAAGPAPLADDKADILKRFVKVLDLAYTRMKDLQTAEMQAREAQIELGLERVRSRAMAMQTSEELNELIGTVFTELIKLDLVLTRCVILIYEGNEKGVRWWMANSEAPSMPASFFVKYTKLPFFNEYLQGWYDRSLKWQYILEGENKIRTDDFLFNETELSQLPDFVIKGMRAPEKVYLNASFNNFGNLTLASLEPLSNEHFDILLRFAKVFDLTYTRFNDLKQAEAQARESQIQLALERVRARTMAMQKSDELPQAANLLFQQVQSLGMPAWSAGYCTWDDDKKNSISLSMSSEGVLQPTLSMPLTEDPSLMHFREAWERGESFFVEEVGGEELKRHYAYLRTLPGVKETLDEVEAAGFPVPTFQIFHLAYFSKGFLLFITYEPVPEAHDIFKRFAKVFDQTYTRFLDLQKAEAQAREAQIEAALERVRSRAMAMHKTDELLDAAELVYKELSALGITSMNVSYAFVDEEQKYGSYYSVTLDGKALPFPFLFPHTETKVMRALLSNWKKQVPFDVIELDEEATLKHQTYIAEHIQKQFAENDPGIPFSVEAFLEASPQKAVIYNFNFAQGYIFVIGSKRLTTEQEQMMLRFTKVFELAYRRFLDIKQAEALAREAQIELALERVRARTMAMHRSEELAETAQVMFHQLQELGGIPNRMSIGVVNEETGVVNFWTTDQSGSHINNSFAARLNEKTVIEKTYKAWKENKKSLVIDLHGDEVKEWVRFAREEMKIVVDDKQVKDRRVHTLAFFSHGWILVTTHVPQTAETIQILERFASVFNLTYRRFLDLQKAEAQANEARIEISLERIRARALAMHKSDELIEVAKVLWEQMALLGQPELEASVVHLYEYDADNIISSRAVSIGTDSSAKLTYGQMAIPKNSCEVVREWLEKFYSDSKEYTIELSGAKQKEWYDVMGKLAPDVVNSMRQKNSLSEKRFYRFSKFSGGALLMVSTQEPSLEVAYLQKRAAAVFDLAYRRFSDLQKTEAQARESEIELALERVRAKSMSMRHSDELADLVRILFKELNSIGFPINGCIIMTYDERTNDSTWWIANSDGVSNPLGLLVPNHSNAPYQAYLKEWKKQTPKWSYRLGGAEKKKWDQYVFTNSELAALPDPVKAGMQSVEDVQLNVCFNKYASITFGSLEPMGDKDFDTLHRFAKVFEQSYTRFLDLQNAEAQAREAKIEAALERVRAKAMAMHRSEDLHEAVKIMFEEFQKLNLDVLRCGVGILNKNSRTGSVWATSVSDDGLAVQISADESFETHPLMMLIYEYWQKQEDLEYILQGQDLINYYRAMKESDLKLPESQLSFSEDELQPQYYYGTMFKAGGLYAFKEKSFAEEDKKIMKRFASVVNLTYNRFLDLQKAEASAREAQIEASLERVRSKTMAMHNSQDVADTVATMFDELVKLGIETMRCGVGILHEEHQIMELWTAKSRLQGKAELIIGKLDMSMHPLLSGGYSSWKNKQEGFYYELKEDDLIAYFEVINNYSGYAGKYDIASLPSEVFHYEFHFNEGTLFAFTLTPFSAESNQIFKRFAGLFGQTYRRYLDLQKAEAQARASQIEAALERVRSKTMAMHNSQDVGETVATMFDELVKLGIETVRCGIAIIDESKTMEVWTASSKEDGSVNLIIGQLDMRTHPLFMGVYEAWKQKEAVTTYELIGEDLKDYFRNINNAPDYPIRYDIESLPPRQSNTAFMFPEGSLFVFSQEPLAGETTQIFKRFAGLFGQTYRRYLDLQRAESQAREAQIEAGLERVRARTMAMHSSDDVSAATATMFTELEKLGIENLRGGITIIRPDQTQEVWSITNLPDGTTIRSIGVFDMKLHPLWQALYKAQTNNESYNYYWLAGKEKEDYISLLNATPNYLAQPIKEIPDVHVQSYFFGEGGVWTNSLQPHSEDDKQIMKRFASVFSLTFRRYQDLKKAEAQAREATIEAALEKVRGQAMAMHNSNDLSVTTSIIIGELKKLGITPIRCGVGIINRETHKAQLYTARFSPDGDSLSVVGWALLKGHPVLENIYEKWSHGEDYFPELSGDSLKSYYQQLLAGLSVPLPEFKDGQTHYGHFFSVSVGCLYAWADVKYNDDEIKILKRFASIIDLTFRRYFELQKSEANAREAVKQAALDRVRADIASMRTVSDLDRITPLIWKELTILGVPFIRCGVFIMDETQKLIHTFLSTPEGKAIAAFHLPYDTPGNVSKVLENWQYKKIYVDHWDKEEFSQFADILLKQGTLSSREQYLKTIPEEGFYLHFLPFLQGMLYVGNTEQLNEEQIELIQHVADAFSTAYARYEDFNKLEAAKQQVENTLTDLKQAQQQLVQSEKMASLGELTAGIAHEIQNPLNFVNNFSDVSNELLEEMKHELEKGNKEDAIALVEDVKQNLEKILHHGKRADAIVKGMLQHSRTSSGQKEPTDINVLTDEYLRLSFHGLRAKDKSFNAKFETHFDNSIGKISVIPQDIGRVILNLINNAFYAVTEKKKHVSAGSASNGYEPTVTVTTKKENGKIEIKVKDNGSGIPQKVLDKIFQPFFTTKPTGQGTGLGLSLAYDIVTKGHGGELKVETNEGIGSTFIIELPAN